MSASRFGADCDHKRHLLLSSSGKNVSHSMSASICTGHLQSLGITVHAESHHGNVNAFVHAAAVASHQH